MVGCILVAHVLVEPGGPAIASMEGSFHAREHALVCLCGVTLRIAHRGMCFVWQELKALFELASFSFTHKLLGTITSDKGSIKLDSEGQSCNNIVRGSVF